MKRSILILAALVMLSGCAHAQMSGDDSASSTEQPSDEPGIGTKIFRAIGAVLGGAARGMQSSQQATIQVPVQCYTTQNGQYYYTTCN